MLARWSVAVMVLPLVVACAEAGVDPNLDDDDVMLPPDMMGGPDAEMGPRDSSAMDASPDAGGPVPDAGGPVPDASEPGHTCSHSPCVVGGYLDISCSPHVEAVCVADLYCCYPLIGMWDQTCVDAYNNGACP